MTVPDFQSIMLPLLRHLGDGREWSNSETADLLAREFRLTEEELTQRLPSGQSTVFANRVAWAKAHLKKAGVIDSPRRAVYRITNLGREVITDPPAKIDLKFLDRFPGHREFRAASRKAAELPSPLIDGESTESELTPEEHIELGYDQLREQLAEELLLKVKESPPDFFERLVIDLLLAMGYGGSRQDAGKAVGRSGDGGIDGIINEDRLGLDVIYVQAKRWEGVVGRPEIQKFAGALQGQRARKGIFITTSSFTKDASDYAKVIDSRLILMDGDELTNLMIDYGIGVADIATYTIRRLDSDYFTQE
ncbi:MAG: restriction endonuclease [Planctomycetaceae bacterium]